LKIGELIIENRNKRRKLLENLDKELIQKTKNKGNYICL